MHLVIFRVCDHAEEGARVDSVHVFWMQPILSAEIRLSWACEAQCFPYIEIVTATEKKEW
jgi:hypothetical protein